MTQTFGSVHQQAGKVIWELDPDEARDLADFIESHVGPEDHALRDVKELRQQAFYVDLDEPVVAK